ncbi:hypothetical protein EWM64_g5900 [Hericium alpestre]|uniref:Sodium/calcium exchanger membrane region domain-containing protein n=1 Tax=Hericium alpestre TaxID=135208 RepID=A0A4Y9ZW42_9AGAM|nr:hypothetical protein EWM64_g5900 [Hericium alpestre]
MIPNTPPGPRLPLHRSTSGYQSSTSDTPQRHNVGTSYFSQPRRPSSPSPGRQRPALARSLSLTGSRTASDARPHGKGRHDEADLLSEDDEEDAYGSDVRHGQEAHLDESPDAQDSDGEDVDDTTKEDDPITVRDRQSLINVEHPFGLPIWKPALYKKSRTVTRNADQALHSIPSAQAERHLLPGNVLWTLCFGWWFAVICFVIAGILFVIPYGGRNYSTLVFGLGWYLAWPFGKYVEGDLTKDDFLQADEERPQLFDEDPSHHDATLHQEDEETSALPSEERHNPRTHPIFTETSTLLRPAKAGTTLHGPSRSYGATSSPHRDASATKGMVADEWLGKLCFWLALLTVIVPLMLLVSLVCWGLIVAIPMAKLNWALLNHLIQHPTSIRFCSAPSAVLVPSAHFTSDQGSVLDDDAIVPELPAAVERTRLAPGQVAPFGSPTSTVLLCIYRAGDWQYFKYTVGGVNIFFINLLPVVFFVIFDGFVILPFVERREQVGRHVPGVIALLGSRVLVFLLSLLSVIPLSYFIGMAVASISAQSSIGMGAVINASFGSIVEVLLYAIALTQGKGRLVEGSIVGSLLAGVLLMPGSSMCSGAIRRKEQKFNAKSAGVTSTMLIMAIIGTMTPTLFYQTFGNVRIIIITSISDYLHLYSFS